MPTSDSTQIPSELLTLAACDLPNYRRERNDWLDSGLSIVNFDSEQQETLRALYETVNRIALLKQAGEGGMREKILKGFDWAGLARRVAKLNSDHARGAEATADTLTDLGNGSINVVFGLVQLMESVPSDQRLVEKCWSAARDTAKIMRLLVRDLDPETRDRDEANKPHEIDHFTEKWRGMKVLTPRGTVEVQLTCTFDGRISARCLETSTIDQITYSLIDSACRFSDEELVRLFIFPVNPSTTRWVVQYRPAAIAEDFSSGTASDLNALFGKSVEYGGSTRGLQMVAHLISECFGLDESGEATDRGYVGGKTLPSGATLWFHWPSN